MIGYGTNVQGIKVHGSPIGMDEAKNLRTTLSWENDHLLSMKMFMHITKN